MKLPSDLNGLIEAFGESGIGLLELQRGDVTIALTRGSAQAAAVAAPVAVAAPAAAPAPAVPVPAAAGSSGAAAGASGGANPVCGPTTCDFTGHTVVSPVVGRVLPAAAGVTFPRVGDIVTEGEPVLSIEILKAAHEVVATQSGTVAQLHVSPGDVVEWGTPLMTVTLG